MSVNVREPPKDWRALAQDLPQLLGDFKAAAMLAGPEYALLHYDDLHYRKLPEGVKPDQAWWLIKLYRMSAYRELPLKSTGDVSIKYRLLPELERLIHEVDSLGGQWLEANPQLHREGARFVTSALIEESIASSLIEGVATTRQAARELIRSGRPPQTRAELQVVNNFRAMQFVRENSQDQLTPEGVLRIHGILTNGWLDSRDSGALRMTDDVVVEDVVSHEVLHVPPPAAALPGRLRKLCEFANGTIDKTFVHPLVRATALHFMLAYDHPFVDGNGRTARALFHWSMLHRGFRMYEYLAISRRILKRTTQYPRAFRLVETDEFDLTYFLEFQLTAVLGALKAAHEYLKRKQREHRDFVSEIRRLADFNYRQQALLIRAVNQPDTIFTVRAHASSHGVTLQTARRDLEELESMELLVSRRQGRTVTWEAVAHVRDKLQARLPKRSMRRG